MKRLFPILIFVTPLVLWAHQRLLSHFVVGLGAAFADYAEAMAIGVVAIHGTVTRPFLDDALALASRVLHLVWWPIVASAYFTGHFLSFRGVASSTRFKLNAKALQFSFESTKLNFK